MVVFTILKAAKTNNLSPEKYISHLLIVLSERFAHDLKLQIDDLLLWADRLWEL